MAPQADHVREPGCRGSLQETRGVGPMQRLHAPTTLRAVVTVARGAGKAGAAFLLRAPEPLQWRE